MNGNQSSLYRDFCPVTDPSKVSRLSQCNDRYTASKGLVDPKLYSLFTDSLPKPTVAIDDRDQVGFADYGEILSSSEIARFKPTDVPGHSDDAMTVVTCEVSRCQVSGDALTFLWTTARFSKNIGDQRSKQINLNQHAKVSAV